MSFKDSIFLSSRFTTCELSPTQFLPRRGIVRNDTIWDRMLFRKVHQSLGGQVKLILTGSAPVSERVLRVIRAAVGCFVVEGYGQTECTAGVTGTPLGEYRGEVVGPPLPCNYVKLIDVPDMNYFACEGRGEVSAVPLRKIPATFVLLNIKKTVIC